MPLCWQQSAVHWERDQRHMVARAKKVPDREEREALHLISYTEGKWPVFCFPLNLSYMFPCGLPQAYCWALWSDCWETESSFTTLLQVIAIHSDFLSMLENELRGTWPPLPLECCERDKNKIKHLIPVHSHCCNHNEFTAVFLPHNPLKDRHSQEALKHVAEVVVSWHMT